MKIEGIGNIFIFVKDFPLAMLFYRDVLGLPLATQFQTGKGTDVAIFFREGTTLGVGTADTPKAKAMVGRHTGVTLLVDNVEKAVKELKRKGVKFTEAIRQEEWGKIAVMKDPDGNELALAEIPWRMHL